MSRAAKSYFQSRLHSERCNSVLEAAICLLMPSMKFVLCELIMRCQDKMTADQSLQQSRSTFVASTINRQFTTLHDVSQPRLDLNANVNVNVNREFIWHTIMKHLDCADSMFNNLQKKSVLNGFFFENCQNSNAGSRDDLVKSSTK